MDHGREMFQRLPFPFADGQFPRDLGAVVQVSVLTGEQPAREVVHTRDGSWTVGDGVDDPNLPGASVATHISHAVEQNSSMADLATMPPGHLARRSGPGEPWSISVLEGWGEEERRPSPGMSAWLIAGGPLVLAAVIVWYLATWTGPSARGLVVVAAVLLVVIGSTVAAARDVRTLAANGVRLRGGWVAAVLLLYPVGAPAYLISRTRKARTTTLVPVAWFVSVVVLSLAPALVPA